MRHHLMASLRAFTTGAGLAIAIGAAAAGPSYANNSSHGQPPHSDGGQNGHGGSSGGHDDDHGSPFDHNDGHGASGSGGHGFFEDWRHGDHRFFHHIRFFDHHHHCDFDDGDDDDDDDGDDHGHGHDHGHAFGHDNGHGHGHGHDHDHGHCHPMSP